MAGRLIGLCLIIASLASADDFSTQREAVLALGQLTVSPAWREAEGAEGVAGDTDVKAIYFDGLDYKGKPTRVFAWLGFPANHSGTVPGVVLVHGGGGTAFEDWVRLWTTKGFAAISIAVEGQTSVRNAAAKDRDNPSGWQRHAWAGPRRIGIYGDSDEPLKDQWMYHAVADTILANSLLRSLPEVDAGKVGVMGISWGGVITSTKPLDRAFLVSTTDTGVTGDRKWIESPAALEKSGNVWRCAAPLPEDTTAWFINVRSGKLTASSDYQEERKSP